MSSSSEMICKRCGITFTLNHATISARKTNNRQLDNCIDCEHLEKPIKGYLKNCRAWVGELDEFDRPIRNGKLYKPGARTCNRADCVKIAHIIPAEIPQKSPVSRSEPVEKVQPVITPQAVIKPSKQRKQLRDSKPVKLPKAMLDALEAERLDQTYRGEPKRTLNQVKKAVELERYRL